jgi:hypothetical protein
VTLVLMKLIVTRESLIVTLATQRLENSNELGKRNQLGSRRSIDRRAGIRYTRYVRQVMDDRIRRHYGHEVVVARYTDEKDEPHNYSVECIDCWEVIIDEEAWEQVND